MSIEVLTDQTSKTASITELGCTLSPGEVLPILWVGVDATLLETLVLFQTKICEFP